MINGIQDDDLTGQALIVKSFSKVILKKITGALPA
jgi:hypothetical protein